MVDLEQLSAELAALNADVGAALTKRKAWMDAHMADYARYRVGDELFDLDTGVQLGVVSRLYRYWDGGDPFYDTSMSVQYEWLTAGGWYDNSSRQPGLRFGNAEEYVRDSALRASHARFSARGAPGNRVDA
jgi:hypothetical protein